MAQILVRDLNSDVIERLKGQAKRHGRSLQGEVKVILEAAAKMPMGEARQLAARLRQSLEGRIKGDSADLIREDPLDRRDPLTTAQPATAWTT